MQLSTVEYCCEVVTPMFLAGADTSQAELRVPSLRGALRFWWRAQFGHLPVKELHIKEAELFGSSQQGQSRVRIKITDNRLSQSTKPFPQHPVKAEIRGRAQDINVLEYLAYGTYKWNKEKKRNEFIRSYLNPGKFSLRISYPIEKHQEVKDALYLLSNFGGLGSCARNGFGSFIIHDACFHTDPAQFLTQVILPSRKVEHSALSSGLKLFKTREKHATWDGALAELGTAYYYARKSLAPDQRKYVALPFPGKKNDILSAIPRRAKPYFMHISKSSDGYEGRMLYLPSAFYRGKKIRGSEHDLDQKSAEACTRMNEYLSSCLEVVI